MLKYPWPKEIYLGQCKLILLSSGASQKRHDKGSDKGGWFRSKDIPEDMPVSVRYAKKAYSNWNSKRVKLAKTKKRYKDSGGNDKELEGKIKALEGEVAHLRVRFDKGVVRANSKGYKIDSRGNWANKPYTGTRNENINASVTRAIANGNRANRGINTSNADDEVQKKAIKLMLASASTNTVTGKKISDEQLDGAVTFSEDTGDILTKFYMVSDAAKNSKRNIVDNLAEKTALSVNDVNDAIHQWAMDSNEGNVAISMQQAASEEFDVPLSSFQEGIVANWEKIINTPNSPITSLHGNISRSQERRLLQVMYDETQKQLADAGIDEVTLYRGFRDRDNNIPRSGEVLIDQSAMSSWSVSPSVARVFASQLSDEAGRVVKAVIPASRILSCPSTGFGCLSELEFVVLGSSGTDEATVFARTDFS